MFRMHKGPAVSGYPLYYIIVLILMHTGFNKKLIFIRVVQKKTLIFIMLILQIMYYR